jgi:hypothetical protein
VFDFLNGDDEDKAKDPSTKPKQAFMKGFGKEMNTLASFNMDKMIDIHTGLKTDSPEKWAMLFLNDETLVEEYRFLNPEQKEKTNKALGFLSEALVHLQDSFISSAHAQEADQFIDTGRETSVLGGLGITAIGMLIFPKFIKKSLHMTTVLQRNPLRRGIFYLATYFMANMSVKSTKKKIKTIDHNIKIIEKIMTKDGIPFPDQNEEESALHNFMELIIPSAHAARKNIISSNLVPLCVEGKKFTTSCTCIDRGTCGNKITNVKLGGALFQNYPLKKTVMAQLGFMQKMETGKVTDKSLNQLERTMSIYAKDLNPVIAANNIDWVLRGSEFPKMNIVQRSKGLVASLQKQAIEEIAKQSGKKIDLTKIDFNSDATIASSEPSDSAEKEETKKVQVKPQIAGIVPTPEKRVKSKRKEQDLKDFVLDVGDINQNETHNLFKMINNRYQKVWLEKKIISN